MAAPDGILRNEVSNESASSQTANQMGIKQEKQIGHSLRFRASSRKELSI